eukprot:649837-Rhodomonas_salina.1
MGKLDDAIDHFSTAIQLDVGALDLGTVLGRMRTRAERQRSTTTTAGSRICVWRSSSRYNHLRDLLCCASAIFYVDPGTDRGHAPGTITSAISGAGAFLDFDVATQLNPNDPNYFFNVSFPVYFQRPTPTSAYAYVIRISWKPGTDTSRIVSARTRI